jgi:hypothetical protein
MKRLAELVALSSSQSARMNLRSPACLAAMLMLMDVAGPNASSIKSMEPTISPSAR